MRLVSLLATREELQVETNFDYPPIPCRSMDWSAIDGNTYDASYEGEDENGHHWRCSPCGHGETEREAINDLLEQLADKGSTDLLDKLSTGSGTPMEMLLAVRILMHPELFGA